MPSEFTNVYADPAQAKAYATLEYSGTYYLAFRDLPVLLRRYLPGCRALDFGCGTGRSTRFLKDRGFQAEGIDIAEAMLVQARLLDPQGRYRLVPSDRPPELPRQAYDLVLAALTFDNIPTPAIKADLLRSLCEALRPEGRIVLIVSTPEIYLHEWASFSTQAFPENQRAQSGDPVRIVMLDVPDSRPVEDILFTDAAYREVFEAAGLRLVQSLRPLGALDDPITWVSETTVAPWSLYELAPAESTPVSTA
jgi:SAM-dependent methyltransferase